MWGEPREEKKIKYYHGNVYINVDYRMWFFLCESRGEWRKEWNRDEIYKSVKSTVEILYGEIIRSEFFVFYLNFENKYKYFWNI